MFRPARRLRIQMTQQGMERNFVGLNISESTGSKKIPPAVAPKPKIHNSAPAPFRPGGGTYRQFRDQGNDDIPPPPLQTNYQDDQAFPPPPPEDSKPYMYQDLRDDFPPPPPQEINMGYTRQSPEPGQRGNNSSGYSSSNIGYGESPPSRSYDGQYNSPGIQYTYQQEERQNPYIRSGSPAGRSSPYNPPSNYANISNINTAYSSSGPTSQVDNNTIYARPVKVSRDSPEMGHYGRPGGGDPPSGYIRKNIQEHRINDQPTSQSYPAYNHPGSGGPPPQHSPPYSARSGGFTPQYDYEDRSDRPMPGPQVPQMATHIPEPQQLSPDKSQKEAEVDALTSLLLQNMESSSEPDFFGVCVKCGKKVLGENNGCLANDQVYHIACFVCVSCGTLLRGKSFYSMDGKPYCEPCYVNTLEKCSVCSKPITDRLLRATGKPYHPACFTCVVCGISLDGIPFTVDATNQIHCIEDFHKKFAPRCCVCQMPIMPERGQEETVRVVAMDKSFHVQCYRCEDCGLLLSSEAEGRGCYPLDDHILCKNCNAKRIQAMSSKMATEL